MKFIHTTFLGDEMSQTEKEFHLWEFILNKYSFKRIIDLGTWRGSHALFLYLFAINKNADFYTFDNKDYIDSPVKKALEFEKHFFKKDIFKEATMIRALIKKTGRTILFCDDGNKIKEFKTFRSYLKIGDIIAIHDWNVECSSLNINCANLRKIAEVQRLIFFEVLPEQFKNTEKEYIKTTSNIE